MVCVLPYQYCPLYTSKKFVGEQRALRSPCFKYSKPSISLACKCETFLSIRTKLSLIASLQSLISEWEQSKFLHDWHRVRVKSHWVSSQKHDSLSSIIVFFHKINNTSYLDPPRPVHELNGSQREPGFICK